MFLFVELQNNLIPDVEKHLADCIRKVSELEFGPTISEQQEIVQDYVQMKKLNLSLLMAILVLIRQHKTTPWE